MRFERRPFAALVAGYGLGLALLILIPNLVHDLFLRQGFSEFGSRGGTVYFDFFVFGVLAVPSTVAFALALAPVRRRLGDGSSRVGLVGGLVAGLSVGAFAGVGALEAMGSRLFPTGGSLAMVTVTALTGIAAAMVVAAIVVVATGARRSWPANRTTP